MVDARRVFGSTDYESRWFETSSSYATFVADRIMDYKFTIPLNTQYITTVCNTELSAETAQVSRPIEFGSLLLFDSCHIYIRTYVCFTTFGGIEEDPSIPQDFVCFRCLKANYRRNVISSDKFKFELK